MFLCVTIFRQVNREMSLCIKTIHNIKACDILMIFPMQFIEYTIYIKSNKLMPSTHKVGIVQYRADLK